MPRKQKQYHYIYKTTNIITNKYYFGMHSTNNLGDGYVGSGKRLWYSINKYGKEKHNCQILEFLPSRKSLKQREAEIVNEELLNDTMCMNLVLGGNCGFDEINKTGKNLYGKNGHIGYGGENLVNGTEAKRLMIERGTWEEYKSSMSISLKEYYENGGINPFLGKTHTEETKRKIGKANSKHQQGKNNSQYNTCWIYSLEDKISKKIKQEELLFYTDQGWLRGRKMKF